jgi:translation elongation factor aEF-1 beta
MANVMVSMKIFPEDVTVSLDQLKEEIKRSLPQDVSVKKFGDEPVAFGLVAIIAHILVPEDKAGEMEKVENAIRSLKGVSNIEIFMMQRW